MWPMSQGTKYQVSKGQETLCIYNILFFLYKQDDNMGLSLFLTFGIFWMCHNIQSGLTITICGAAGKLTFWNRDSLKSELDHVYSLVFISLLFSKIIECWSTVIINLIQLWNFSFQRLNVEPFNLSDIHLYLYSPNSYMRHMYLIINN